MNRRNFIKKVGLLGAGYAIIPNLPVVSEIEGLKEPCKWGDSGFFCSLSYCTERTF